MSSTGDSFSARRRRRPPSQDVTVVTREQGAVSSLLESFGFVRCAERPEDVFFHYSEVVGGGVSDWKVGQEVEFERGSGGGRGKKPAALRVQALPPGTVVWEEPEGRHQGRVTKAAAAPSSSWEGRGRDHEGTIALEDEPAVLVKYTPSHYHHHNHNHHHRGGGGPKQLCPGDDIECDVVRERRTGQRWARNIALVRSAKERAKQEKEERLRATATPDVGVVLACPEPPNQGWIRAVHSTEYVRFHKKHVEAGVALKTGQEVSLQVCREETTSASRSSPNPPPSLTARDITLLADDAPPVVFHTVVKEGVEGVVTVLPTVSNKHHHGPNHTYGSPTRGGTPGRIRVDLEEITEVLLHADDAPGGIHANPSSSSSSPLVIQPGDTLLLDVVRVTADGSLRAVGTTTDDDDDPEPRVRLVRPALPGRAHGIVSAIKEGGFGFIALAERNADAYFRLTDVLPDHPPLQVGTSVSFDLSTSAPHHHNNNNNANHHRKENLKAQRLATLPEPVETDVVLTERVRGTVCANHTVELQVPVKTMSWERRHPIVHQWLTNISQPDHHPVDVVTLPHPQSTSEAQVIWNGAEALNLHVTMVGGNGVHSPNPAENGYARIRVHPHPPDDPPNDHHDTTPTNKPPPPPPLRQTSKLVQQVRCAERNHEPGDAVLCTVVQSRRTGACSAVETKRLTKQGVVTDPQEGCLREKDGDTVWRFAPADPPLHKGDHVKFEVGPDNTAVHVRVVATKAAQGIVLMEPSHTSLGSVGSHNHHHHHSVGSSTKSDKSRNRWNLESDHDPKPTPPPPPHHHHNHNNMEGVALIVADPSRLFAGTTRAYYRTTQGAAPRRGDLVSLTTKKQKTTVRLLKRSEAPTRRGTLTKVTANTASFDTTEGETWELDDLKNDILGCDVSVLEDGTKVEGIWHRGAIHGVCRITDLYLESKVSHGKKERPRLNLTVKKELQGLGGKIVAQSGLAKGPDGTIGFVKGWTDRESRFAKVEEEKEDNAEVKKENVDVKKEDALANKEIVDVKEDNAEVKKENAEVNKDNVKKENVDVKKENTEVRKENVDVEDETVEVKKEAS